MTHIQFRVFHNRDTYPKWKYSIFEVFLKVVFLWLDYRGSVATIETNKLLPNHICLIKLRGFMDQETITYLREVCKKIKEIAELSDRFLALQAAKKEKPALLFQEEKKTSQNRLIPLVHWNKHHDWPSISALRGYAFMRHRNGFDKVISKVGKRLVIDEQKFFDWVRSNPKAKL